MGNRIQGFLAGVFVTGCVTAYTAGLFKSNQALISQQLQSCDSVIKNRILSDKDRNAVPTPINRRILTTYRPSVWETCKDIWNDEIITVANWAYSINWYQWGLEADKKLNKLADKVVQAAVEKK